MTQYSMTPINNGTRMRKDHNVYAAVIQSYNTGQLVVGDELWIAPADGNEVKQGDQWLKVVTVNGNTVVEQGWMAHIHKGVPICNNFKTITDPTPPVSGTPIFPESFILTEPSGARAEYTFLRIIES